jgi:hypothetical protein
MLCGADKPVQLNFGAFQFLPDRHVLCSRLVTYHSCCVSNRCLTMTAREALESWHSCTTLQGTYASDGMLV